MFVLIWSSRESEISQYRESDKRADGSYAFESLSRSSTDLSAQRRFKSNTPNGHWHVLSAHSLAKNRPFGQEVSFWCSQSQHATIKAQNKRIYSKLAFCPWTVAKHGKSCLLNEKKEKQEKMLCKMFTHVWTLK